MTKDYLDRWRDVPSLTLFGPSVSRLSTLTGQQGDPSAACHLAMDCYPASYASYSKD